MTKVQGEKLKGKDSKDKETVLILHGWNSSKEKWQAVKRELEKAGIKVFVPDLPGFKEEMKLKKPWTLDNYVTWVKSYTVEKVEPPFFMMGHSFGGAVAAKYASEYEDDLSGLILISAAVIRWKSKKVLCWAKAADFLNRLSFLPGYETLRRFFYYYVLKRPDYIIAKGPLRETFKNIVGRDLTHLLPKIKAPCLLIWGKEDKLTLLEEGKIINSKLKNSKMVEVEGVGHIPHRLAPEIISKETVRFIKKK